MYVRWAQQLRQQNRLIQKDYHKIGSTSNFPPAVEKIVDYVPVQPYSYLLGVYRRSRTWCAHFYSTFLSRRLVELRRIR